MGTALVTDSTAYLSAELRSEHRIAVVPLHVYIGGHEHREGVDVSSGQVARALREFTPVTTSRPSPQAFLDAYEAAAREGADSIVTVHISADMSSTIGSAQLAASHSPVPVTVVDSRVMGMAMGYAALSGAAAAADGADAERVAQVVRDRCAEATVVFYVDTLEYLRRGGRIGMASALLGSALSIKPILGLSEGHIVPVEKVRTAARAIARLEELAVQAAGRAAADGVREGVDVAVHHLDSAARAERLAEQLREHTPELRDLRLVELGAVVGAHVGPGTLAVTVSPRLPAPAAGGPAEGRGS